MGRHGQGVAACFLRTDHAVVPLFKVFDSEMFNIVPTKSDRITALVCCQEKDCCRGSVGASVDNHDFV